MFRDVLGGGDVGADDNFFALGGDSLRGADVAWLLPWVLVPSLVAGVLTGVLANLVLLRWQGYFRAVA